MSPLTEGFEGSGLQQAKSAAASAHHSLADSRLEMSEENALKWLAMNPYSYMDEPANVDDFIEAFLEAFDLEKRNAEAIAKAAEGAK